MEKVVTTTEIIMIAAGGMFTIIIGLVGFIMTRFVNNLNELRVNLAEFKDAIVKELQNMNGTLVQIDRELRDEIHDLDNRVIQLEIRGKNDY